MEMDAELEWNREEELLQGQAVPTSLWLSARGPAALLRPSSAVVRPQGSSAASSSLCHLLPSAASLSCCSSQPPLLPRCCCFSQSLLLPPLSAAAAAPISLATAPLLPQNRAVAPLSCCAPASPLNLKILSQQSLLLSHSLSQISGNLRCVKLFNIQFINSETCACLLFVICELNRGVVPCSHMCGYVYSIHDAEYFSL